MGRAVIGPMRKRSKTARGKRTKIEAKDRPVVDVVSQLETAIKDPIAAALGAAIGGIVPWFGRELAHNELAAQWYADPKLVVVAGCMLFSMLSVYTFGRAAFGNPRKAIGFVAALEGVMLVSHGRIGIVALCVLIMINAIANGCTIALSREATVRRREADARRSATRARRREAREGAARAPAPVQVTRPTAKPAPRRPAPAPAPAPVPVSISAPTPNGVPAWQPRTVRLDDSVVDAEIVNEWRFS